MDYTGAMQKILVVDDEQNMCKVLKLVLEKDGYAVETTTSGRAALEIIRSQPIHLLISDLKMPDLGGMDLLKGIRELEKKIPVIIISAYGNIQTAVDAMKLGAVDFITKPFNKDLIRHKVRQILPEPVREGGSKLGMRSTAASKRSRIVYRSEAMKEIMATVDKIASVPRPVLLLGESGSGKELVAKEIHRRAGREEGGEGMDKTDSRDSGAAGKNRPFVSINCPTLPEPLFESELFGYKRGAFTNANEDYLGKIRLAEGGTLFLDEIAEIPISVQAKLLRFLEDRSFIPLGGTGQVTVHARIICATNRNIQEMVKDGGFRKDLYYRINTIVIKIPPLRERKEDIPPLIDYFNEKFSLELGIEPRRISPAVVEVFMNYNWPGNIRELRNMVERVFLMSSSPEIEIKDVPEEILIAIESEKTKGPFEDNLIASTEKTMLIETLVRNNWNLTRAARELGITRSAIRWRINKYGLANPGQR
jgi:DNA-binding NtrC family response regulator